MLFSYEDFEKPSELQSGLAEFATVGELPNCSDGLKEVFFGILNSFIT